MIREQVHRTEELHLSKLRYDREDRAEALIGPSLIRQENALDHVKLRKAYEESYEAMRRFRFLPRDEIRAFQFRKVRDIVTYAYQHVPLYRRKYGIAGFEPGDLKTWDDFHRLPLLSKDEIIAAWPDEAISDEHDAEFMTTSSGSSGRFVYLAVSENAVHFENLQMGRQNEVQGAGRIGDRETTLFIITCPWWFTSTDGLFPQELVLTRSPVEEAWARIQEVRPAVLSVYASYMRRLAALDPDLRGAGVKLIIVHSESSTRSERRAIADHFGIDVRDEYSSEELLRMALECPYNEYHVEQDVVYLETVDPQSGLRSALGEPGEVVGTNFVNFATPFIRYRQGDVVRRLPEAECPCGSHLERISAPLGRMDDNFVLPGGLVLSAGTIIDEAYNWVLEARIPVNGLQYQIVQSEPDRVDIYLVIGPSASDALRNGACDLITTRMRSLLGDGVRVATHSVDRVPHSNGRKTKAAISLICREGA